MMTTSLQELTPSVSTVRDERSISAVFKTQKDLQAIIERLQNRGIPIEAISILGRDFSTNTRVAGFITKKDVILGGLRQGAIFGSLFGSVLSLLSGVGILFVPFVGPVIAAGPLGAALLGAASGAIVGSAGTGLASLLATLGMPEDKAAIYQTKVSAGEYLVMVEVPTDRMGEYQLLLESAGGEEIHRSETALPQPCRGECVNPEELAPEIRNHLAESAQLDFISTYNKVLQVSDDASQAEHEAWEMIRQKYQENEQGVWS